MVLNRGVNNVNVDLDGENSGLRYQIEVTGLATDFRSNFTATNDARTQQIALSPNAGLLRARQN